MCSYHVVMTTLLLVSYITARIYDYWYQKNFSKYLLIPDLLGVDPIQGDYK